MAWTLAKVTALLDQALPPGGFADRSNNGLQVENSGRVRRICCGVDASLEFFEAAARRKADLVLCHHGLSWDDSLKRITELNYRRIRLLMRHDMALYASHLPLDAHPKLGNNALICRRLGLRRLKPFGFYHGGYLGFTGELPRRMPYPVFKERVARCINPRMQSMDFGKPVVRTVAVVSGGASGEVEEAGRLGVDVFLSGEPGLSAYSMAQEYGIHALFAGHYATERFGVRALGEWLTKKTGIPAEFIDLDVPF